jgi:hypothetical protein
MKLPAIILTILTALAVTLAPVQATHKRHRMHATGSNNPNGTAGGPTTLSGTGSSKFGGNSPGTAGKQ